MCKQSPAKILRNVIRITKFLERKRSPKNLSKLSTTVASEIRINLFCSTQTCELPQQDHALATHVPSQTNPPFFATDSQPVSNQLQPVQPVEDQPQPVQDQPQPVQDQPQSEQDQPQPDLDQPLSIMDKPRTYLGRILTNNGELYEPSI